MLNKVGLSNLKSLNTDFFKKSSIEFKITLNESMPDINKATSIMFSEKDIKLEKTSLGILFSFFYQLKIMYIPLNNSSLHIIEENSFFSTEIYTNKTLYWDSIEKLIRGNKFSPKLTTYEISLIKIDNRSFFIKVFFLLEVNYSPYLNIGMQISNNESQSNLFLTDKTISNLNQITFENLSDFRNPCFDKNDSLIYYEKFSINSTSLEMFNLKLNASVSLIEDFTSIESFKIYKNIILINGETSFLKGLFSYTKKNSLFESIISSECIIDFTLIDSKIFILEELNNEFLLSSFSLTTLSSNSSSKILYKSGKFSSLSNIFVYLDNLNNLNIISLDTFREICIIKNSKFNKIFFLKSMGTTLIIGFEITPEEHGILSYDLKTTRIKYILNKPINIKSIDIDTKNNIIYLAIKNNSFTQLISIDTSLKIKVISKFDNVDIKLFIF